MDAMNAMATWHAEGLRWIAALLTDAAAALERHAGTPHHLVASRCVDEARFPIERYY